MTTIRKFCCNDLLGFTSVNLDHLTITRDMSFYLKWILRWSKYTHIAVAPGNRIMGYILGAVKEDDEGVRWYGAIRDVSVASEYRRQKLATKLMGLFEKKMVEKMRLSSRNDHYYIVFYVGVFNIPAQSFFKKLGYEVVETIPEFFSKNDEDAYKMDKEIVEERPSRVIRSQFALCSFCKEAKSETCSYVCLPPIV